MAKRGRPVEKPIEESPTKFSRKYERENGTDITWNYDLNKSTKGPMSVEITYPKGYVFPQKPKIDSSKYVGKEPVVMVYKKTEKSKPKIKSWKNKNIDQILIHKNIGLPESVIIIELGVGNKFIEEWMEKHKIA